MTSLAVAPRRMRPRVIPVLLLQDRQLYKTVRFRDPKYVGDPRVAVKILNDKGCDELILLDISATPHQREPDYELIGEIAAESFMPVAYGGGIRSVEQARTICSLGIEKVVLNSHAIGNPDLVRQVAQLVGVSSTVVSMDVGTDWLRRKHVYAECGRRRTTLEPVAWARELASLGAGELVVNSIDRDGTMSGYELPLVESIARAVDVPVIALGGARDNQDFRRATDAGAAAGAAGSRFVFHGPHRAVLITYPEEAELQSLFAG